MNAAQKLYGNKKYMCIEIYTYKQKISLLGGRAGPFEFIYLAKRFSRERALSSVK